MNKYSIARNLPFFPKIYLDMLTTTKRQIKELSEFCGEYSKILGTIYERIKCDYYPTKYLIMSSRYIENRSVNNTKNEMQEIEKLSSTSQICQPEKELQIRQEFERDLFKTFPNFYEKDKQKKAKNQLSTDKKLHFDSLETQIQNNNNNIISTIIGKNKKGFIPKNSMLTPCIENIFLNVFLSSELYLIKSDIFNRISQSLFEKKEILKTNIIKLEDQINKAFLTIVDNAKSCRKTISILEKSQNNQKNQYKTAKELFIKSMYEFQKTLIYAVSEAEKLNYENEFLVADYCTLIHDKLFDENSIKETSNMFSFTSKQEQNQLNITNFEEIKKRFNILLWSKENKDKVFETITDFEEFYKQKQQKKKDSYFVEEIDFYNILYYLLIYNEYSSSNCQLIIDELLRNDPDENPIQFSIKLYSDKPNGVEVFTTDIVGSEILTSLCTQSLNPTKLKFSELFGITSEDYIEYNQNTTNLDNENDVLSKIIDTSNNNKTKFEAEVYSVSQNNLINRKTNDFEVFEHPLLDQNTFSYSNNNDSYNTSQVEKEKYPWETNTSPNNENRFY